mmetsp:Transcript_8541/g.25874  ORF Transcript_8541/g.25874 Transcript_8541/m.25874 type:complete len:303 (-) Transcript_8541:805-1713(-)
MAQPLQPAIHRRAPRQRAQWQPWRRRRLDPARQPCQARHVAPGGGILAASPQDAAEQGWKRRRWQWQRQRWRRQRRLVCIAADGRHAPHQRRRRRPRRLGGVRGDGAGTGQQARRRGRDWRRRRPGAQPTDPASLSTSPCAVAPGPTQPRQTFPHVLQLSFGPPFKPHFQAGALPRRATDATNARAPQTCARAPVASVTPPRGQPLLLPSARGAPRRALPRSGHMGRGWMDYASPWTYSASRLSTPSPPPSTHTPCQMGLRWTGPAFGCPHVGCLVVPDRPPPVPNGGRLALPWRTTAPASS